MRISPTSTSGDLRREEQPVIVSSHLGLCLTEIALAWPMQ
jgi:hypothetical protein